MLGGAVAFFASLRTGTIAHALTAREKWNEAFELAIGFEINQAIRRVHRPYVAVSIESLQGEPVRTVSLWVNKRQGERWIPDLTRWIRLERARQRQSGGDLIETVSSATRVAGVYTVIWNGKDDAGRLVDLGEYYLCIESNRQNGTYQLLRARLTFGAEPSFQTIKGNYEIIGVSADYRRRRVTG